MRFFNSLKAKRFNSYIGIFRLNVLDKNIKTHECRLFCMTLVQDKKYPFYNSENFDLFHCNFLSDFYICPKLTI